MPKLLKNIEITHISLVKAGANGKEIIYKSSEKDPMHNISIDIKKSDDEKGIVYGIVYAPNSVDTDDEYTTADEILKAAYGFMKSQHTTNIDKDHSFNNEKAFVAESWIIKANDSIFPDEPIGSWAVAIKLEDEELKKGVKDGEIAGISMAGKAEKVDEDITKADEKMVSLKDVLAFFKEKFGYTSVNIHASHDSAIDKSKKQGENEDMKAEDIAAIVKEAVKPLGDELTKLNTKVEKLEKSNKEQQEELKKSKQKNNPAPANTTDENTTGGIL